MNNNLSDVTAIEHTGTAALAASAATVSSPVLRYGTQIAAIAKCPEQATAPFSESAYRGVHRVEAKPDDFLPQAFLEPERFEDEPDRVKCRSWSLSMFESPAQMKKRFDSVAKTSRKFRTVLVGMHCARLQLTSKHGRRTYADANGHFSFYQYDSFDAVASVLDVVLL
jgi:hypothetical protein